MPKKPTTQETQTAETRVAVSIPRGHVGEDPNLFVSVGGVNYLLPRGEISHVPPAVAYEIERAERARTRADRRIRDMLEA